MSARKLLVLLGLLLALMVTTVSAQDVDAQPIAPGETVSGTLTDADWQALYRFDGSAGTPVSILLESTDFDAYLLLLDSDNVVIAEDDDSAGRLNALIELELPADDSYIIVATSLRAHRSQGAFTATGDFMLTFNAAGMQQQPPPVDDLGDALVPGTVVEDTILPDFLPRSYVFFANAGDVVTIDLTSEDFDAYLFLNGPSGDILTRDDDSGDGTNARISGFEIPETGRYSITVDSFGNVIGVNPDSGVFALKLEFDSYAEPPPTATATMPPATPTRIPMVTATPTATPSPIPMVTATPPMTSVAPTATATLPPITPTMPPADAGSGEIAYGGTYNGMLTFDRTFERVRFSGSAGDVVLITLRSDDFDTYLFLEDSAGVELSSDDDSAGQLNSRIGPFELPEDGEYVIIVDSYGAVFGSTAGTGSYQLSLTVAEFETVAYGDSVESELTNATPFEVYRFEGQAGDVVTVDLETPSFNVFLSISGAGGQVDVGTFGGSDLVGPLVLPQDGGYVVTVNSYDQFELMPYTLTIGSTRPQAIRYDTPVTSGLDETGVRVYTFDGQAGELINVRLNSGGSVDTEITLTGPDGATVASDDDSGPGVDPELLGLLLPADGSYALLITPYISGENGEFTLTIERDGVLSLDDGAEQVVRISEKQYLGAVTFTGVAGQTVQLSARVLAGSQGQPFITVTQGETTLATNSIGQVDRLILEFTVPQDGTVQVTIEEFYNEGGVVAFSLTRLDD